MNRYRSYRSYLRRRFGAPVLRVPINGGFDCPNRDGTLSSGGCTFCDNRAFSPRADDTRSPTEQVQDAISRAGSRFSHFIPYLQPYSNTYAALDRLRDVYEPLLAIEGVVGLAIGTRPDCLPDDTLDYLANLCTQTYLSVELGIQSIHDGTLQAINRGHDWASSWSAMHALHARCIEVTAHLVLGLPGETESMMLETARRIADLPVSGVKLHQLMIVAHTPLADMLSTDGVSPLSLERYAQLVGKILALLRPDQYLHRLMADMRPEHGLIAPQWSADKAQSLAYINQYLECRGIVQGMDRR